MGESARVLGNVATRMLFENDRVRIWEMDLPPGGRVTAAGPTLSPRSQAERQSRIVTAKRAGFMSDLLSGGVRSFYSNPFRRRSSRPSPAAGVNEKPYATADDLRRSRARRAAF